MPTPLQQKAAELLEEEQKKRMDAEAFGPHGVGTLAWFVMKGVQWLCGGPSAYECELEKVVRGERDTLPNPSDYEGNDAGVFQ